MIKFTVEEDLDRYRNRKKDDPEHIIFILDRVLTKLRPKVEEGEY